MLPFIEMFEYSLFSGNCRHIVVLLDFVVVYFIILSSCCYHGGLVYDRGVSCKLLLLLLLL